MFRALFAHHQELMETVRAAYGDGMRYLVIYKKQIKYLTQKKPQVPTLKHK